MYRAEFFSYDVQYKDFALFDDDDTELSLDYIAWDASQIKIPGKRLAVIKGDLVHITRDGATVLDGYINNVSYPAKNVTQVDVLPLQCSFKFQDPFDKHLLGCDDLAAHLETSLWTRYASGVEPFQSELGHVAYDNAWIIPIIIANHAPPAARPYAYNDEFTIVGSLTMFTDLLLLYGVFLSATIDTAGLQVAVDIAPVVEHIILEADIDNVVDKDIVIGSSYGGINKFVAFNTTELYGKQFYLHPDGTVDTSYLNRITPVVQQCAAIDASGTWDAEALQRATETMAPKKFDNQIKLTYQTDDNLINPTGIKIGTTATIRTAGMDFESMLTGKITKNNLVTLVFGRVRVDLTKQLLINRRGLK